MDGLLKIIVHQRPYEAEFYDVLIGRSFPDHTQAATEIVFSDLPQGQQVKPLTSLHQESAQMLIDCLWNCGLRPSEKVGTVGQLQATQKHLGDMRKLVEKWADIDFDGDKKTGHKQYV
jgi:hypothetical protein